MTTSHPVCLAEMEPLQLDLFPDLRPVSLHNRANDPDESPARKSKARRSHAALGHQLDLFQKTFPPKERTLAHA